MMWCACGKMISAWNETGYLSNENLPSVQCTVGGFVAHVAL